MLTKTGIYPQISPISQMRKEGGGVWPDRLSVSSFLVALRNLRNQRNQWMIFLFICEA
jgi:hypothetical protein